MSNQRIYVQLGRYGDICNILPLALEDSRTGQRSAIMVSKDFADVLDGVSYADRIVFDGGMWELDRATKQAEQLSDDVRVVQLVGPPEIVKNVVNTRNGKEYATTKDSFLKDQWNLAGRMSDWKKQTPLLFDLRDKAREKALVDKYLTKKRKLNILVSTSGISSPFEYGSLLLELLRLKFWRQFEIIDLSQVKAERIYDLLGLYEHPSVQCLVATDSAPLHLSNAVQSLPVVALVNDKPSFWHGSVWRPNHIFYCRYSDFPQRCVEMLEAIQAIHAPGERFGPCNDRVVVHVWSEYEEKRTEPRHPNLIATPVTIGAIGRDSVTQLKDPKRFPFVKDVVRLASLRLSTNGYILLTRTNAKFKDAPLPVIDADAAFSRRVVNDDGKSFYSPAIDWFCFTKKWWQDNQNDYPDMILGKDRYWDRVLAHLILSKGGQEIPDVVWSPAKLPPPTTASDTLAPRVGHNLKLHDEYFAKANKTADYPPVSDQCKFTPLNRRALFPFGYNPCLIHHAGKRLMAYRWHGGGTLASWLAIAELDADFNPVENSRIYVLGVAEHLSIDDPRLFVFQGDLYCSYVVSTWPEHPPKCVVRYGRLIKQGDVWKIEQSFQPAYGHNDNTALEKNWVPFQYDNRLFFIYDNQPEQVVIEVVGDRVVSEYKSPTPHWFWGKLHGGTTPLRDGAGNDMLRFFHTRMDNEIPPTRWRYRIGAALMEPEPPFAITAISDKPIITGSEDDDLSAMHRASCIHHKKSVVFPMGALVDNGTFLLSLGINDCECAIARLQADDLHL